MDIDTFFVGKVTVVYDAVSFYIIPEYADQEEFQMLIGDLQVDPCVQHPKIPDQVLPG